MREKAPSAIFVHCASHALNLVLNHGSDVIEIRNVFKIVSDTIKFVNDSPKRRVLFGTNLTKMCETRFVQRHNSILKFGENSENNGRAWQNPDRCKLRYKYEKSGTGFVRSSMFVIVFSGDGCSCKSNGSDTATSKILQKVQLCYAEATDCVEEAGTHCLRGGPMTTSEKSTTSPFSTQFNVTQILLASGSKSHVVRLA